MKYSKIILLPMLILIFSLGCFAQNSGKVSQSAARTNIQPIKSSPAYAEVLLRKTELEAELEDLMVDYTEEFPKVKQHRAEIVLLDQEMSRILAINPAEASKLTLALGKLMLRKVELEMDYADAQKQYTDEKTEVKRAKRKVEIFEAAITEILR